MTTYTCSQCGESAPAFDKTPDGRKTIDLPRGWATMTLSGTPEVHKLLCGECVKLVRMFFGSWSSAIEKYGVAATR